MLKLQLALAVAMAASAHAQCPVRFVTVDPNYCDYIGGGCESPARFFRVQLQNTSGKIIRGMKFHAAYYDAVEDLHDIPVDWGATVNLKPAPVTNSKKIDRRTVSDATWSDAPEHRTTYVGWLVVPTAVLFEDGTKWRITEPIPGCYGEYWADRKHPRLTALPAELLKDLRSER